MEPFKRLWRLLSSNTYSVKRASILLAFTAILSNALGLLRNVLFYRFIAPGQLDIYYASFRIPDFLFNIVIFGAISSAFVPIASSLIDRHKDKEAEEVTNQVVSWLTIIFVGIAIVLGLVMRPLMHLVVDGFDTARFDQAVILSRIMLLQSIFFAWSFTIGGYLNSRKRFATYALAPLIYNLTLIIGGIFGSKFGIIAITYAAVIGAFLHFGIQYLELRKTNYRPRIDLRLTKAVREVATLMVPRSISQGMSQLVIIVYTALGSGLIAGSISIFSGMNDLQSTPTMIVANSMAIAFFPTISAYIAAKNWEGANTLITKVVRASLFLLLPSVALSLILRAQVVRLYFGIGGADWTLTNLAIGTFVAFVIGIIPSAFVVLFARVFYALKNTWLPMILSVIAGSTGILCAYLGVEVFHGTVVSLAIADTIFSFIQCFLYLYVLWRHPSIRLGFKPIINKVWSYIVGSILLTLTCWIILHVVSYLSDSTGFLSSHTTLLLFIQLILAFSGGILVYSLYSKKFHPEEVQWVLSRRFSNEK